MKSPPRTLREACLAYEESALSLEDGSREAVVIELFPGAKIVDPHAIPPGLRCACGARDWTIQGGRARCRACQRRRT